MRPSLLWFALFFIVAPVAAADPHWNHAKPHVARCERDTAMDTNICLRTEYERVDARLNALYRKLRDVLENLGALQTAQTQWLRFRDASCAFSTSGFGDADSRLRNSALYACLIDLSEKRIKDIEQHLTCWDTSDCCDCPPRKK
jgi:uncharacterized protein YecT (DUF1311 family)